MKTSKTVAVAIVLSAALLAFASETPDQLRDQGLEALKAAQADETKIVEAARFLAQAAEAYEKAGNDDAAAELNSYLYWCKKRMTLEQTEAFAGTGESGKRIVEKLDAVATQKVEASEVGQWMKRAEDFEAAHPDNLLLCAIRYFEVADRFIGTQESLVAQKKSLDLLGRSKAVKEDRFSPVGEWCFKTPDGKRYIRTFMANGAFTTKNYDPKWSNGRWSMEGNVVVCTMSSGSKVFFSVIDKNTILNVKDPRHLLFKRVIAKGEGRDAP